MQGRRASFNVVLWLLRVYRKRIFQFCVTDGTRRGIHEAGLTNVLRSCSLRIQFALALILKREACRRLLSKSLLNQRDVYGYRI